MVLKKSIMAFHPVDGPDTGLRTRFGGQPTWIDDPQWPISLTWDNPMRFICQIVLDPELFGSLNGTMAYVFLTHPEVGSDFFDPDIIFFEGGENAVIIQPNGHYDGAVQPLASGPSLYLEDGSRAAFEVETELGDDPDFVPQEDIANSSAYFKATYANKIGGSPGFFQGDDWPIGGPWKLLLQLDPDDAPFHLNLGASPRLFAFISADGTVGKLCIQDT